MRTASMAATALAVSLGAAQAKELRFMGLSLGSLGNPGFVSIAKTAKAEAEKVNPAVKVVTLSYDYDLGRQVAQIDNFIAAGADLILLNPGDPQAITPAIRKAQAAGIFVVSVDTVAQGADAAVTTDNVQAGMISCVKLGVGLLNGVKPDKLVNLLPSSLVTRENVGDYKGWNSEHTD